MKRVALTLAVLGAAVAVASPSGHKFFPGSLPVHYVVFNHTTINGMPANSFGTAVLPRIQEAFLAWTSTRVACTSWRSIYDGLFCPAGGGCPFVGPADKTAAISDNKNRVIWLAGSEWRYGNSTLGLTTTWFFSGSGEIVDADMEMNNNVTWANNGSFNAFDYESVVLHEAGHFLGLDHTQNVSASVMFPTVANGQVKRTLTTTDVNDVCGVYPGSGSTGSQGNPCTATSQCTGGLVCQRPQGSSGGKICTVDCTANMNACSTVAPLTCQNADTGKACLPPPASADYCKFCVDGTQCSTGNCLTDGSGHNWCTNSCGPMSPCASGSICLDVMSGNSCTGGSCICAPQPTAQGVLCPGQCTGTTCGTTPGYACNNGTCEASGGEGDRCELSGVCDNCLICIGTTAAATCRRCCAGMGVANANCQACPNATCGAGLVCTSLTGTPDGVCYPNTGADICQACGGGTACINGNTCIGGKCHASCNPQSPGTCGACQAQTATTGFCACPGEERNEGQSCGGSGIAACRTGLVCSSGTCKRTCVVGNASSCPSGQTCQTVGSDSVCVGSTSGTRCASCNGLNCEPGSTCYQGRCYATCNVNVKPGPCDYSCIDVGGGVNLCACDDQIHGSGSACGASPIAACADRLLCVAGTCTGECNPNVTNTCPILTECKLLAGTQFTFVCQPLDNGTGGGGGGNNQFDCTAAGSTCPNGTECVPNGDGTATCKSTGASCDPNGATNQCPANTLCRAVEGNPNQFKCQSPSIGNNEGCGCNSGGLGLALVLLAGAVVQRRRRR